MNIGLMGFEFRSPNKGCEALVYSFLSMIKNIISDDSIVYNFSGTDLGDIPSYFDKIKFVDVPPRLKDFRASFYRSLLNCDLIFDVTMGDSFSDIYSRKYYNGLILRKRLAEIACKKYILLPQTFGPFNAKSSEKKAKKVLRNAYKIYCRDYISQQLLINKFNITDSILSTDMAFILPYNKDRYIFSNSYKIGINVSGLLYKGGFKTTNQFGLSIDYPAFIERVINEYSNKCEVYLIPHVIDLAENSYDDDYKICVNLNAKYPNTKLAPAFNSPIDAKSFISNMDVFIGSRMHATIAAFSSNVITIPVSYSRKFEGLFGSLNYPYVINGTKESTESAFELVVDYVNKSSELSKAQHESMLNIDEKVRNFNSSIISILNEEI